MNFHHISCMPEETIFFLQPQKGKLFVDATLGGCGHSLRILHQGADLIGIDQDQDAIRNARIKLEPYGDRVRIVQRNFAFIKEILENLGVDAVDGILADLGLSLHQIEASGRGFSFRGDEPLDMRMDAESPLTAAKILEEKKEEELARIFKEYGEERFAKAIARKIVARRDKNPITRTGELANLVSETIPKKIWAKEKIHPATRVFMSLRIAVNAELEQLKAFLEQAPKCLKPGGRLVILSFHSLEDRMVKHTFKELAKGCVCPPELPVCVCGREKRFFLPQTRVVRPTEDEILKNPMARSTRLRVLGRIP
ncbi:16S rRNA (cytosine(1402)-N(4))-methyltransferase RsmH [Desulfococcaceae bacterium OttesenSCG-928-F15]|nr:16S rRNA (cytosine(1402)-N(4))-methyltransferase RsmH [Desulfococcaceae bacterium OttesenSCG-928-F15]